MYKKDNGFSKYSPIFQSNLNDYGWLPIEELKLMYKSQQCGCHINDITYKSKFRCAHQKFFFIMGMV